MRPTDIIIPCILDKKNILKKLSAFLSSKIVITAAILIISFSLRYWHLNSIGWFDEKENNLLGMKTTNHSVFHSSDSFVYERLATDINNGKGLNIPYHPPLISILLSIIFYFNAHNYYNAKILLSFLSSLTCLITCYTGWCLFNKKVGITAGFMSSFSFGLIILNGALNTEALFSFFLMTSLLSMILVIKLNKKIPSFFCGIVSGLTVLTRGEFLLNVIMFLICLTIIRNIDIRSKLINISLTILGFIVVITPWTIRNYYYMSEYNKQFPSHELPVFVPLTLNGPLNFVYGNNPTADGGYNLNFLNKDISHPKNYYTTINLDNPEHKKIFIHGYKEGLRFIIQNPKKFLYLLKNKTNIFIDFLSYGFGGENFPGNLNGYRRNIADIFIPLINFKILNCFLLFGSILLIFFNSKFNNIRSAGGLNCEILLPLFFIICSFIINLAFHGLTRSGVVLLPIVFIYQAVLINNIIEITIKKIKKYSFLQHLTEPVHFPLIVVSILIALIILEYGNSRYITILKETYKKDSIAIYIYPEIKLLK